MPFKLTKLTPRQQIVSGSVTAAMLKALIDELPEGVADEALSRILAASVVGLINYFDQGSGRFIALVGEELDPTAPA